MSLKDLEKLILLEAQNEAQKIIIAAHDQADEMITQHRVVASDFIHNSKLDFEKRAHSLRISEQSRQETLLKSAKLQALHEALNETANQTAFHLARNTKIQIKIKEWLSRQKGNVKAGFEISNAIPDLIVARDEKLPPFAIVAESEKYRDVVDLLEIIRGVINDGSDEFVALLTNP